MQEDFSHILEVIRRTGDKCIVFNETTHEALVVMPLSVYENMTIPTGMTNASTTDDEIKNRTPKNLVSAEPLTESREATELLDNEFSIEPVE